MGPDRERPRRSARRVLNGAGSSASRRCCRAPTRSTATSSDRRSPPAGPPRRSTNLDTRVYFNWQKMRQQRHAGHVLLRRLGSCGGIVTERAVELRQAKRRASTRATGSTAATGSAAATTTTTSRRTGTTSTTPAPTRSGSEWRNTSLDDADRADQVLATSIGAPTSCSATPASMPTTRCILQRFVRAFDLANR